MCYWRLEVAPADSDNSNIEHVAHKLIRVGCLLILSELIKSIAVIMDNYMVHRLNTAGAYSRPQPKSNSYQGDNRQFRHSAIATRIPLIYL